MRLSSYRASFLHYQRLNAIAFQ